MFVVSHSQTIHQPKSKFIVTSSSLTETSSLNNQISSSLTTLSSISNQSKPKRICPSQTQKNTQIFSNINHNCPIMPLRQKIKFRLCKDLTTPKEKKLKLKEKKISKMKRSNHESYITGRWNLDEHQRFVEAIIKFGNDWKQVQKYVKTRSSTQARSHAQKFFVKIKKAQILKFNLDLSKNSIKMLHDLMNNMSSDESKKMIKALNSVAFEKKVQNKKEKKNSKKINNIEDNSDNCSNSVTEEDDLIDSSFLHLKYVYYHHYFNHF